ncbi:MAG: hypothetical protein OXI87_20005 [Albidovulum sp.]|nr:hypothetical protein [Albidovulum sp.]
MRYGAEKRGGTVVPVSGELISRQVQPILDFRATATMVAPSHMLSTMDEYAARRLDPGERPMRIGIFRAEPWTNSMRERIESVFGIHAVHIYGLSEIVGPGAANECVETKDGPHIWEDRFCPEVIGPRTSEALPDGESGELDSAALSKEAMAVVR